MKFHFNKKYFYWGLTAVLVIIAGILFYYVLFHNESLSNAIHSFITISMPIIDGLLLAYLMTPIVNAIEQKIIKPVCYRFHIPVSGKNKKRVRMGSILLTICVIFVVAYGFLSLIIPELIRSIQSIVFQFPIYIENLQNWMNGLQDWLNGLLENNPDFEALVNEMFKYSENLGVFFETIVSPKIDGVIISLSTGVIGFLKGMWNFIIGFIISIYILGSKETFVGQAKKIAYAFFDIGTANQIISTFRFTHTTFSGFIGGKVVDSIIIGIICFICTNIIGTPYATLVSVIVGVTNLIPFFGPWIGGVPSTLLILMVNPMQALYFLILIFVIQQFDGNILGPKILGDSTGLSGFWVIFSITIFGGVFGIVGMVVGVPIFAVCYAGFKSLVNKKLAGKNLPTDTQPYLMVGSISDTNIFTEYVPVKKKRKPQNNAQIIDSISQEVEKKV